MKSPKLWIRCRATWPDFVFDHVEVAGDLAAAHRMHGVIEGKAGAIGLTPTSPIVLEATAEEVVATAAIEGKRLSMNTVRSSVKRTNQWLSGDSNTASKLLQNKIAIGHIDHTSLCGFNVGELHPIISGAASRTRNALSGASFVNSLRAENSDKHVKLSVRKGLLSQYQ